MTFCQPKHWRSITCKLFSQSLSQWVRDSVIYVYKSNEQKMLVNHMFFFLLKIKKNWGILWYYPSRMGHILYFYLVFGLLVNMLLLAFSKHRPSGPMLSITRFVHMCVCVFVCLSVCVFTFEVPFKHFFAPTSPSLRF